MAENLMEAADVLVRQAVLAPSSHNTQPWRFQVGAQHLDVYRDRSRALPVNDPQDRELTLSCGCALMNLRAAAAARGLAPAVTALPDSAEPDRVARLSPFAHAGADHALADLAPAIPLRRTLRGAFTPQAAPPGVTGVLAAAAAAEGAVVHPVEEADQREALARWVGEGDRRQWADPAWRRELAAWMGRRGEGLPVPRPLAPLVRLLVSRRDLGERMAARDGALVRQAPLLMVLATAGDGPRDWLAAGQSLQRLLLVASARGLQAGYLNQPIQVPELRAELAQWTPGANPQVVVRLGAPRRLPGAPPRRPLAEVLGRTGDGG